MRFNVTGFQLDPMPRIFWAHLILWEISFGKAVIWLDGCKKLFVFPQYQYLEASDQVGTPLRWSARTHSVFYGTICQDWCSRLDVTWTLPLLAKLNCIYIDKILYGKNWTGSIFWAYLILREIAFGKAVIWLDGCKKLFLFFFNTNTSRHRIKLEPRYVEAQGPILSFKVPFVKIGVAVWTLPGYNHFWQS